MKNLLIIILTIILGMNKVEAQNNHKCDYLQMRNSFITLPQGERNLVITFAHRDGYMLDYVIETQRNLYCGERQIKLEGKYYPVSLWQVVDGNSYLYYATFKNGIKRILAYVTDFGNDGNIFIQRIEAVHAAQHRPHENYEQIQATYVYNVVGIIYYEIDEAFAIYLKELHTK